MKGLSIHEACPGTAAETGAGADAKATFLRLLHWRGLPRHGVLPLHVEGRGMADALALVQPGIDDPTWRDANRCRIVWRSDGWTLSNQSLTLVCALNGRRIRTGQQAILRVGHVLELGLMRFLVEEDEPRQPSAEPWNRETGTATPRRIATGSPWSVLPAYMGRNGRSGLAPRVEPWMTAPTSQAVAPAQGELPLVALHDEFLRVVRDPSQLVGASEGKRAAGPAAGDAPTLEALADEALSWPTLRDLLMRRESIDETLGGFDVFDFSDTPASTWEPEAPEVLSLFAPDIACPAAMPLPGLTRREHHALSPDSPMPLSLVADGSPPASKPREDAHALA